ncbi:MAG TPA: cytochrome bc complex cytochrome b subunit [Arenicellales bacterium]|uniref:Cytochrome b n=1 Tax=hydrothermal vent metagenome TaxID=652676 RepID=A0A160TS50_9ZZZZ|nr:cytochrome bc complex cytochrome b subunit [Pseudomonadota bacterium]PDH41179.1 MAG: cytochrome b [Candidatus Thioglobus sp. MED-G25]HJM01567.1 cytochrome bc complex cytochrome b subunit [Arenicellales bacterium]MEC9369703.1 cytochrome bc complex cytochrome b subunit [Pseudomonadota bacterium]MED5391086.1 cytochrome bc complex cytochrome b subunit [Pseudomonadota bacterium]|tara:strand:- start:333 stop:1583 length:1251 start_codon:yes stop_codon:yes gene_type:complete
MARLMEWVDERFPATKVWEEHVSKYYTPKNFNFWYYFGSLLMLVMVLQIVTGIVLTMHYKPDADLAFASVEYIMRDVPAGWFIRYLHSVGASMLFLAIYLHMFRAMLYGSYKGPRELIWILGMILYIAMMAEAFFGYLLPWGNMSYWGAQVIISLFGAIPVVGEGLAEWIRGDFVVSDATLNRFFAFHVILLPLLLALLVYLHIVALHKTGSNNPDGVEIKKQKDDKGVPLDGIPFHPYYTVKDIFGAAVFMAIFLAIVFFAPELSGWFLEKDNFEPANILQTPPDIVPLWYLTPYYSILRAVTFEWLPGGAKLWGVMAMGLAIVLFFFLPWLDRSKVKSIRYRGWMYKFMLGLFAVTFVVLGYLGTKNPGHIDLIWFKNVVWAQIGMVIYFAFFLLMPIYTRLDRTKPEPDRLTG